MSIEREKLRTEQDNLQMYARRNSKAEAVRKSLSQALKDCGDSGDLEEVKKALFVAASKLNEVSKKNGQRFSHTQKMVEQAKTKQDNWWNSIKSGLGIPLPEKLEFKKESDGSEQDA